MLSPDQVASQGPGGFLNLNGGPTDPYYALSNGAGYATVADACAAVPQAARRNRTVNVGGSDYWWLQTDLSDNGLILKSMPGGPGGTGSPAIYADFIFTAETDGAQSFPLPAGTLGIVGVPSWFQPDTGQAPDLANYDFIDGNFVVYAATDVKAGDKFFGQRYCGGTPGAGGDGAGGDDGTSPIDASRLSGIVPDANLPPLTPAKVSQLTTLVNQENANRGPLVLTAQPLLATPVNGALEFDGVNFYKTTGGVRTQF